jgi:hypothetical protein
LASAGLSPKNLFKQGLLSGSEEPKPFVLGSAKSLGLGISGVGKSPPGAKPELLTPSDIEDKSDEAARTIIREPTYTGPCLDIGSPDEA